MQRHSADCYGRQQQQLLPLSLSPLSLVEVKAVTPHIRLSLSAVENYQTRRFSERLEFHSKVALAFAFAFHVNFVYKENKMKRKKTEKPKLKKNYNYNYNYNKYALI